MGNGGLFDWNINVALGLYLNSTLDYNIDYNYMQFIFKITSYDVTMFLNHTF